MESPPSGTGATCGKCGHEQNVTPGAKWVCERCGAENHGDAGQSRHPGYTIKTGEEDVVKTIAPETEKPEVKPDG